MTPSWERVRRVGYLPISTAYTNVINQRLALPVTYLAWRLGLTPNHLTLASGLLTSFALLIILLDVPHGPLSSSAAYLLLSAAYVLDSSDGQLARVADLASRFGAVFDHFVDGAKIVATNLCFGWVLLQTEDPTLAYLAMGLNTFAQSMLFFGSKLKIAAYGANLSQQLATPSRRVRVLSFPFQFVDWGLFIWFAWLLAWPYTFLWLYLAYGFGCTLTAAAYAAYSAYQMRRADAAQRGPGSR